jgi:hypothetical protein
MDKVLRFESGDSAHGTHKMCLALQQLLQGQSPHARRVHGCAAINTLRQSLHYMLNRLKRNSA